VQWRIYKIAADQPSCATPRIVLTQHAGTHVGAILLRVALDKVDDERKTLQLIHRHDDPS
jgi:hypothetical protein